MVRRQLRAPARASFIACGASLIAVAVALALLSDSELPSVAAMVAGVLLVVFGAVGELPEEIGLQRISFGRQSNPARDYREALYDAVRVALPELNPPRRAPDWHPSRPTYWVDELDLRIVVTWAPDESYRIDVSVLDPVVERTGVAARVLLVTNVDEIDDLQAALRRSVGERGAVVRWRSPDDTADLGRTARKLRKLHER
jgi:hypothetical protein